jgi:hypothetical protein
VGFATVAIGVGPFLYSFDLKDSSFSASNFKSIETEVLYPFAACFSAFRA